MQFEIIPSESGHAIIMDGFANIRDAEIFCSNVHQALLEKEQSDQAQIEVDAIDQSKYITVDTDAIPMYNGLAELANIKGMNPKDVMDMRIQNDSMSVTIILTGENLKLRTRWSWWPNETR